MLYTRTVNRGDVRERWTSGPISLPLKLLALLMFIFLLAPLLVVLPISFSGDNYMMFPPTSWSTRWYGAIFADAKMVSAFTTSIALASVVTVLSLAIGLPAAYALGAAEAARRGSSFIACSPRRCCCRRSCSAWRS